MKTHPVNFWERLKEISRFFQGRDQVHKTLRRLVKRLDKAGIPYAILGGMAVFAHGHKQATDDVDVLVAADCFSVLRDRFVPDRYTPSPERPRKFVDVKNDVIVHFRFAGASPRGTKMGPIVFPRPDEIAETIDGIHYVTLVSLIELKLAARRFRDLGDVANLIAVHNLDESFLQKLHPSLHRDYLVCLDEKRREKGYES
jgi:hypothetical protein